MHGITSESLGTPPPDQSGLRALFQAQENASRTQCCSLKAWLGMCQGTLARAGCCRAANGIACAS